MNAGPPVVPGDDRVACQHCPARVQFTGAPALAWIDPDAKDQATILFCAPQIWHKPMPTVRLAR